MGEKNRPKIQIRLATAHDVVRILRLLEMMHEESDIRYPAFNQIDVVKWITGVLEHGFVAVAMHEERMIGSIALVPAQFQWNRNFFRATTQWFFVQPKFRKGGTARGLLKAAKDWAHEHDLVIALGTMMGRDTGRLDRFLRLSGFRYAGGNFVSGDFVNDVSEEDLGNVRHIRQ